VGIALRKRTLAKAGAGIFAIIVLISVLFPYLWLLDTGFKNYEEVFKIPPVWIPDHPTLDVFKGVLGMIGHSEQALETVGHATARHDPWITYIFNSFYVGIGAAVLCLCFATLAGFGLARLKMPGGDFVLMVILVSQMFPGPSIIVPLFDLMRKLGLFNTYIGLILLHTAFVLPFTTWLAVGAFRTFPTEIEEAAIVDGASRTTAFLRVVLPLMKNLLATTALFAFIMSWSEFLFALMLMKGQAMFTVPVGLSYYIREYDVFWNEMAAAAVVVSIPVLFLFTFIQRYIVRGLTAGALSGQ
jgi:ABC-type glycerol-3-phosphate transport system permease component